MVCIYVRLGNSRALSNGLSPVHTHKPYNNFLIAPACMCNLNIVSYMKLSYEVYAYLKSDKKLFQEHQCTC